jgi:hypothetical protein
MLKFQDHLDNTLLSESMDSALDFYMTDDTIMPKQIYASVSVNGSDYGISLVETTYDKVYVLELYRIVSVKRRNWSFKTPSDIRPVLSTLLKFVESSYPFIKNRMHGIIIDIPGSSGSEKYERLLSRIIKKTYIQTFRVVPVKKTTDKAKNFLFIVKKSVTPETIFSSVAFKKHFEFDPKGLSVAEISTSDNLEQMITPYKIQKPNVSLEPSKKYAFKKIELGNEIDVEDIKVLDDIANKASKSKNESGFIDLLNTNQDASNANKPEEQKKFINLVDTYNKGDDISDKNFPIALLIAMYAYGSFTGSLKYDVPPIDEKLDNTHFVKQLKSSVKSIYTYTLPTVVRKEFVKTGLVNSNGLVLLSAKK